MWPHHRATDEEYQTYIKAGCNLVSRDSSIVSVRVVFDHPLDYNESRELVNLANDHGCCGWIAGAALVIEESDSTDEPRLPDRRAS